MRRIIAWFPITIFDQGNYQARLRGCGVHSPRTSKCTAILGELIPSDKADHTPTARLNRVPHHESEPVAEHGQLHSLSSGTVADDVGPPNICTPLRRHGLLTGKYRGIYH